MNYPPSKDRQKPGSKTQTIKHKPLGPCIDDTNSVSVIISCCYDGYSHNVNYKIHSYYLKLIKLSNGQLIIKEMGDRVVLTQLGEHTIFGCGN